MDQCWAAEYVGSTNASNAKNVIAPFRNRSNPVFLTWGDIWISFLLRFRLWNDTIQSKESYLPATNSQLLLPCRLSLSPKSVGQLISSEPEGVITRAAITRTRRRHTRSVEARQQGSRQRCLWIQISMQNPCPHRRTRAAESSCIWVTLVKWFERQALGVISKDHTQSWTCSRTSGTSHLFTLLRFYVWSSQSPKRKKKKACCGIISFTQIADLNIY